MTIFLTGASGYMGTAITRDLLTHGHSVSGLARSDSAEDRIRTNAACVTAKGGATIEVVRGSMSDLDIITSAALRADAMIHCAFNHDYRQPSDLSDACRADRELIAAVGEVYAGEGKGKMLIVTSSGMTGARPAFGPDSTETTATLGPAFTEQDAALESTDMERTLSEVMAAKWAKKGANIALIRLPTVVHGSLEGEEQKATLFVPRIIRTAGEKGFAAFAGDGRNRWPAAHVLDAAVVYRLVLEHGMRGGEDEDKNQGQLQIYHAVADEGIPLRELAKVIGDHLGLPAKSITPAECLTHFGIPIGYFQTLDNPVSSQYTRKTLGWQPSQPGLLDELKQGKYF